MPPSATPDPEQQTMTRELGGLLEGAIDRLADGYREVFVLREIEGMSTSDTADALAVSEDVVKTRLSRARAMMRRDLFERAGLAADNVFAFHQSRCDRVVAAVLARIQ
jgi:RNA polymerase sigma-70 factor (ECF subfamily)